MYLKKTGFTLVEVMVASTIGAFISLVAVGTLQAVIAGNELVDNNIEASSEIRFAANLIERDLNNFYHTDDIANTKLLGTYEILAEYSTAYLAFYTLNRTKARPSEPECDIYEVEYYLEKDEGRSALVRRLWPNPSEDYEPGGILTTIAENIDYFEISYYDGEEWYSDWPEEMETLPHMIEVNIVAAQLNKGVPIIETFLVNLTRTVTSTAESL